MKFSKDLMIALLVTSVGLTFGMPKNALSKADAVTLWPTSLSDCQERFERISFCHATSSETNPYNFHYNQPCTAAFGSGRHSGHFQEGGTTAAGHEDDYFTDDNTCGTEEEVPTDVCENIEGNQEVLPENYEFDENGDCVEIMDEEEVCEDETATNYNQEGECEYEETEPTPTPTPTPTPHSTVKISYSAIDPECNSNTVSASIHIQDNNVDQSGVRVVFKYSSQEKIAYTGNDGRASVGFDYTVDGHVEMLPDGFASQLGYITKKTNCEATPGQVLGATTQGQVLGATTYAETGIVTDVMMSILGLAGATLFATGSVLHVKNKA